MENTEKTTIWNELKQMFIKPKPPKKKYIFLEPSLFRKNKKKKIIIRNGLDYMTLLFYFVGLSYIPSFIRKDYGAGAKLLVAQIFPIYVFANAYMLKSKPIMGVATFTMLISIFITMHYVKANNANRIRKYLKAGIEEMI